tara:strand:- start:1051 stop:1434 length:384 start_codon:yes stop_codon:yes gene_type:complete
MDVLMGVILVVCMIFGIYYFGFRVSDGEDDIIKSDAVEDSNSTVTEFLSGLPATYYVLATLCGLGLLFVTLVNAKDLSGAEIGGLIGYTVGAVLSMFAVGRAIELLEDIRDAVRSNPALSPSRSEDE